MLKRLIGKELAFFEHEATPEFWAANWDEVLKGGLGASIHSGIPRTLLRMVLKYAPAGGFCLEAGCGVSNIVWGLERLGYQCAGLDFSTRTLGAVRAEEPRLPLVSADVRRLPLRAGSVDFYISQGVIEHFPEGFEPIIEEMARVLAPAGVAFVSFPAMSWLRRTKASLGRYESLASVATGPDGFYQFALDPARTIERIEERGFQHLESAFYEGVLGLRDESSEPLARWMGRLYAERKSHLASGIRRVVEPLAAPWAGYCVQLAFRRTGAMS